MATNDPWGAPLTEGDDSAVISAAITDYVTMAPAIERHFAALEAGGPMARAVLAQLLTQSHRPELVDRARSLTERALGEGDGLSRRERGHLSAAWSWARGDLESTISAFGQVLSEYPGDLLALRSRYLLLFNAGDVSEMLATVRHSRRRMDADAPLASYLDGMEAFALEERGHYDEAEELARRGVDADQRDLWAIHAVAHVLEMQQRRDEGVAWLTGRDHVLETGGAFAGHLWWHLGLQLLALGRGDAVLNLYDRRVYPGASEEGLDLSNAISLLARLEMRGVDVGRRWDRLVAPCTARLGQHSHPFNDTHFVLALSRAGARVEAEALLDGMRRWSRRDDSAAEVLRLVALAVAEAMAAHAEGRWHDTVHALGPHRSEIWRLGGSHAQRALYTDIIDHAESRSAA